MRILVGITGGIAAFKAVALVRQLTEKGHDVKVVPTQNALRFVGAATLEALSKNTVDSDLYTDVAEVKHIELAKSADLVIVAPATASFIARTAAGIADDLLSNVVLATSAPILIAPAMHTEMWNNAATMANIETLKARGLNLLEPAVGRLTGSDTGQGRLPEPDEILEAAFSLLVEQDLAGRRVVVTAGGTREAIDPVRFIGNASSGRQGLEIAKDAARRGAEVTLIGANFGATGPFEFVRVVSVAELDAALSKHLSDDIIVMAAAISDFRVESPSALKIEKANSGESLQLNLIQNEDILARISAKKRTGQVVIGFAAQTQSDRSKLKLEAAEKLARKGCDIIVANDVSDGKVFDQTDSDVLILSGNGSCIEKAGTKSAIATAVLDAAISHLN
jgi:phosphopantothenoylcysteine decarboxylase/phosphopantothenate--cysteine ligase